MRFPLPAAALLLIAGAWLNTAAAQLLPAAVVLAVLPVALLAGRRWPGVVAFVAGFALLWIAAEKRLADRLPEDLEGRDIEADVRVTGFPEPGPVPRLVVSPVDGEALPAHIRLSWYDDARPAAGECWRLKMRLRLPRGFSNPGRFDYEFWLFSKGYGATGYVRQAVRQADCDDRSYLARIRSRLAARIRDRLPADDATAVILAVTLGARQWLDDRRWQQFATTGTSHLMAISGMHVALASGAVFLLLRLLLAVAGPACHQAVVAGIVAGLFALSYAALSGFAVPSRRAVIMLALALLAVILRRAVSSWSILAATACAVAILSPLDVLSTGFRLSFAAVALLLLAAARDAMRAAESSSFRQQLVTPARTLARLQVFLVLGMLPLTAILFGRLTWTAVPVNLLVVPLFNFAALPAALAGVVLPFGAGDTLLIAAWHVVRLLLLVIETASRLPMAELRIPAVTGALAVALMLAGLAACLPRAWPGRRMAMMALPLLVFPGRPVPPEGCFDADVLDVGQGLAVVIRTHSRTLVYDTGPSFRSGSDTGRLVVVPFLDYVGVRRVDRLVVSHADNDHAGGVASLVRAVDVASVLAGEKLVATGGNLPAVESCRRGIAWTWDRVDFAVLHPVAGIPEGNDASCVIEIRSGRRRMLLTGDIEAGSERGLAGADLLTPVDVVLVPHHGSKTSSGAAFVRSLSPRFAIASAGYRNRWNMPVPEVVDRWSRTGADVLTTAQTGAIGLRVCGGSARLRYRHRVDRRRFWTAP